MLIHTWYIQGLLSEVKLCERRQKYYEGRIKSERITQELLNIHKRIAIAGTGKQSRNLYERRADQKWQTQEKKRREQLVTVCMKWTIIIIVVQTRRIVLV